MITSQARLMLASGITFRSLGEGQGAVIVETRTGQLYTCNDTTTAFLEAIDGQRNFKEIVDQLHELFYVNRDILERDLNTIATNLRDNGLIAVSR